MVSDRSVKEVFFNLEAEGRVFDFQVDGVSLYFMLRFNIEIRYRNQFQKGTQISLLGKLKSGIRRLFSNSHEKSLQSNSSSHNLQPSSLLFVSTSDWVSSPGESIELVDIIKYFHSQGRHINFAQPQSIHLIEKQSYHDGFVLLDTRKRYALSHKEENALLEMLRYLSLKLKVNYRDEFEAYKDYISFVLAMAQQLVKIIEHVNCSFVFARSVYTNPWIPIACMNCGVACVEVQHGVVTPDNIYYQTGRPSDIRGGRLLFPQRILTVGEEWRKILVQQNNLLGKTGIFTLGSSEHDFNGTPSNRSSYNVLICLQNDLFSIDNIIIAFLKKYKAEIKKKEIRIIIRPHPNALKNAFEKFDSFTGENLLIENSREIPLSQRLQCTDLVVSATSMVLYEALSACVPVISFDSFRGVTIPDGIKYVTDSDALFSTIIEFKAHPIPVKSIEYISRFNPAILNKFID